MPARAPFSPARVDALRLVHVARLSLAPGSGTPNGRTGSHAATRRSRRARAHDARPSLGVAHRQEVLARAASVRPPPELVVVVLRAQAARLVPVLERRLADVGIGRSEDPGHLPRVEEVEAPPTGGVRRPEAEALDHEREV